MKLRYVLALFLLLLAFGFLGRQDYEEDRSVECSNQHKHYDAGKDECYKPTLLKDMV